MKPSSTTFGDFVVYRLVLDTSERIEFEAPNDAAWLTNANSVNLMFEGGCSLFIRGSVYENGLVVPHSRTEVVPTLSGFEVCRQGRSWVKPPLVTLTVTEPSVYLCFTRAPTGSLPLNYSVVDADQAVIPASALFISQVDCTANNETFVKCEPHLNGSNPITLAAQTGKVVIVQKTT